jgi:drug/metabolite transporter (DMT)-like permease
MNHQVSYFCGSMKKAFIQLHIAVFLAGFTAILGKLITLNEGMLVWYRMLITAITLFLLLYFRKELQRLSVKDAFKLFGVGAVVALHWVTFYGSIKYANVSVSLTCLSAIGFFTAFLDPIIMRRRIDVVEVFLGALAIAGIYLIFDFYPEYKLGIFFGIISALLASLFPIFNKNLLQKFSARTVTLYEMGGGFIALTFIMPLYLKMFPAKYYLPTNSDWLWLLVLAWICTVLTFILALNALKKISPFTANLAYNLEPVYGIILAFIIFHENKYLSAGFYFGLGLILLAVLLQMTRVGLKLKQDRRVNMENKFLNT